MCYVANCEPRNIHVLMYFLVTLTDSERIMFEKRQCYEYRKFPNNLLTFNETEKNVVYRFRKLSFQYLNKIIEFGIARLRVSLGPFSR